ncbi:MAG TPA: hypothetical protein VLX56_03870 [Nitrososphaerales archaeon]|nr:hypothetical protein [Nitrososphaerales archaeon]
MKVLDGTDSMRRSSRPAIGRMVAAGAVIVVLIVAVGVGILFTSGKSTTSSTTTTTSSSSTSSAATSSSSSSSTSTTGCVFNSPQPAIGVPDTETASFTGCIPAGGTAAYNIAVSDPDGVQLNGTITVTGLTSLVIGSAKIGSFLTAAGQVYNGNITASLTLPPTIALLPQNGYAMTFKNLSGQNDTVTISLQFYDLGG